MPQELFLLRPEHEAAFGQAGIRRFQKRAERMLRRRYPGDLAPVSAERMTVSLESWTKLARGAGLVTEKQMFACFETAVLLWRQGGTFEQDRTVAGILRSSAAPEAKATRLNAYVRPEASGTPSQSQPEADGNA